MPRYVRLDVSGQRGNDAPNGRSGTSPGQDGTDAGHSTTGGYAGNIAVDLSTEGDNVNISWNLSNLNGQNGHPGAIPLEVPTASSESINASAFTSLTVRAAGGKGGWGGNGGDGAKGERGAKGYDAQRGYPGQDGGPGGPGGDAGAGTNGSAAGAGGNITLQLAEEDSYMLVAVKELLNPSELFTGASGGRQGTHGTPGAGGDGGQGGNSLQWTEKVPNGQDAEGNPRYRDVNHYERAGARGDNGPPGSRPTHPLNDGRDAPAGNLDIKVGRKLFKRRYNVDVESCVLSEGSGINVDGVFEFGEVCHATNVKLYNNGGMPTPSQTRIRCHLQNTSWTTPTGQEIYHNYSIPNDSSPAEVQGAIAFKVNYPTSSYLLSDPQMELDDKKPNDHDYDPVLAQDKIIPLAVVLGKEDGPRGLYGPSTLFQRELSSWTFKHPVTFRFPVEQQTGIDALTTLAVGETTLVNFGITNISHEPLGERRRLQVRLWIHDEELKADDFFFRTTEKIDNEGSANATDLSYPGKLWTADNWQLAPGETKQLEGRLKLKSGNAYEGAEIRAVVYLSDIDQPEEFRVVQRRMLQIKNVPEFHPRKPCEALLVCSLSTSRELFSAWQTLLTKELGLHMDVYGLTRYGSFEPSQKCDFGDTDKLRDYIGHGALVIILDQEFQHALAGDNARTGMCLSPWHLRACPEASSKIDPPNYLVVNPAMEEIYDPNEDLNGDIETTDAGAAGHEKYEGGALPGVLTACWGAQSIAEDLSALLGTVRGLFAEKAEQKYETFKGKDGTTREDKSRPFDHLSRWERENDPYRKYAEMQVDYKLHCCTSTFACCCCCCECDPQTWREKVLDRVAVEVGEKIDAAGLEGTIRITPGRSDPVTGGDWTEGIGKLQVYVQPKRRCKLFTVNMPLAGWQEVKEGETNAASLPNRYLVAVALPLTLKLKTLVRALEKNKKKEDGDAQLSAHAAGHALVGTCAEEFIYIIERKSVEPKETLEFLQEHMPTCHALCAPDVCASLKVEGLDELLATTPLAIEMASELEAIGEAPMLTGWWSNAHRDCAKVLAFVAKTFAARFKVTSDGEIVSQCKQRVTMYANQDASNDPNGPVHDFVIVGDSTVHSRGDKQLNKTILGYAEAFGSPGYESLLSGEFGASYIHPAAQAKIEANKPVRDMMYQSESETHGRFCEPPVSIVMDRDIDSKTDGSYLRAQAFRAALVKQREDRELMGTSDAKKQEKERKAQIAKERTGETSTEEDLETQDIKVRPPVYANGYPVEHVAPFPPTVPGKPVPFLPAVPFTGKVVSGTPVVERPALMPQGSIKAMAADHHDESEGSEDESAPLMGYGANYNVNVNVNVGGAGGRSSPSPDDLAEGSCGPGLGGVSQTSMDRI